jgi:hypothetical protein
LKSRYFIRGSCCRQRQASAAPASVNHPRFLLLPASSICGSCQRQSSTAPAAASVKHLRLLPASIIRGSCCRQRQASAVHAAAINHNYVSLLITIAYLYLSQSRISACHNHVSLLVTIAYLCSSQSCISACYNRVSLSGQVKLFNIQHKKSILFYILQNSQIY